MSTKFSPWNINFLCVKGEAFFFEMFFLKTFLWFSTGKCHVSFGTKAPTAADGSLREPTTTAAGGPVKQQ